MPTFDIRARTGYYERAAWVPQIGRRAHIYVFAYHPIRDESANHCDPRQWRFHALLSSRLPDSKTIGLSQVASLSAPASWQELGEIVEQMRLALPT